MDRKATILFVEDDKDYRDTISKIIEDHGYRVIGIADPIKARKICYGEPIDLLIADVRLVDDKDSEDTSGINLAKDLPGTMPKILITGDPRGETALNILKSAPVRTPASYHVVLKQEGVCALISKVEQVLKKNP